MAEIKLTGVGKTYPNGVEAVRGLDLTITDGEFMVLVGPSGCGKSTALRMIAGLEAISDGELTIGADRVNGVRPSDRNIAMVFQNYALYPHKTVAENIGFPLKIERRPKREIAERVAEVAATLELTGLLDSKPGQLSGGQRQRVAMGRAIIRRPQAFLMDEPLSNLDAKLRAQMRAEILQLQSQLDITTVYVTHDQVEAMTMGDRVAVLRDGILQQVDRPQELYDAPVNVFVAGFIGSPSINLFRAELERAGSGPGEGGHELVVSPSIRLSLPTGFLTDRGVELEPGPVTVGIRPDDLHDALGRSPGAPDAVFTAPIELVEALGSEILVHLETDATPVDTGDPDMEAAGTGSADGGHTWIARFGAESEVVKGRSIEIAVDTDRIYLFDAESGVALGRPARRRRARPAGS